MSLEEQELATAQAHYDAFLKDSQLDDREGHDKDDIAASRENADLAAAFDAPVHAHHAKIDVIENTDFGLDGYGAARRRNQVQQSPLRRMCLNDSV